MAASVRFPDDSLWVGTTGRAQVGPKPRAVRPRTPFAMASITKSFMAALVLQLGEKGRLSLTDPISRWLPELSRTLASTAHALTLLQQHGLGIH